MPRDGETDGHRFQTRCHHPEQCCITHPARNLETSKPENMYTIVHFFDDKKEIFTNEVRMRRTSKDHLSASISKHTPDPSPPSTHSRIISPGRARISYRLKFAQKNIKKTAKSAMSDVKFFRLRPAIFDSTLRGAHNEEPGGVTGATARDQTEFGRK